MRGLEWNVPGRALGIAGLILLGCSSVRAADLCVNPPGAGGCATKIAIAVAAAAPYDVIHIAQGVDHENVVIGKPPSLLGQSEENTIIDGTGLLNGINADGIGNPGLAHVIVRDFTVRNANAQGIGVRRGEGRWN